MKICLIDAGVFIEKPELMRPLERYAEVVVWHGVPQSYNEVIQRAYDSEVIAFGIMQFTNEMLDGLPNLKVLQFIGTGVWNFVDVSYAQRKGIRVLNIDGYGSNAVAEFAVAMAFTLSKKIQEGDSVVKKGLWEIEGLKGKEISASTVGVVGTGNIGRLVAEKFANLKAKVVACDIYENEYLKEKYEIKYVSLQELFSMSDIITLHMKVTEENTRLIDRKYLGLMKRDSILVNVARAELMNNEDLYKALLRKEIGGAAIDVYENEPPAKRDLLLAQLENVLSTPHIAYYTQEANDNSIKMIVNSIIEAIA